MEKELILKKLEYIKENLKFLENLNNDFKSREIDNFEKLKTKSAISKTVEEIVETAIKVNNLLLNEKDKYSYTYKETFLDLLKFYNLDKKLFEKLSRTAKFRNEIVHNYSQIKTQKKVEENIEEILLLYSKYVLNILNLLRNRD